ncbi:MAG: diacylglycerol kinase family protein [Anaerolineaceae bacterium]|nr:diacylglycerol kinase family protein [Anaerolineaceae bacterium]
MNFINFVIERINSIKPAIQGLIFTIKNEKNTRIHSIATILAIILIFLLKLNYIETLFFISAVFIVWITEFFNTAIEYTLDFIHADKNPKVKIIKDISAAGVLLSAIYALLVAFIIIVTKILSVIQS